MDFLLGASIGAAAGELNRCKALGIKPLKFMI
jgi:hypothetical protein